METSDADPGGRPRAAPDLAAPGLSWPCAGQALACLWSRPYRGKSSQGNIPNGPVVTAGGPALSAYADDMSGRTARRRVLRLALSSADGSSADGAGLFTAAGELIAVREDFLRGPSMNVYTGARRLPI